MDLPKRKPVRLPEHDYSAPGAYFVTVCTHDRRRVLSRITPPLRDADSKWKAFYAFIDIKANPQKYIPHG